MYYIKIDQLEKLKKALVKSNKALKAIENKNSSKEINKTIENNNKSINMIDDEFLHIKNY